MTVFEQLLVSNAGNADGEFYVMRKKYKKFLDAHTILG